jgi:hypothetical protein
MATDFSSTFKELKKLFGKESDGELAFLRTFIGQGKLVDKTILDTSDTIDFSACGICASAFYKTATELHSKWTVTDPTRNSAEIKYRDVQDLLVTIRNRFLHFRTGDGQKNMSSRKLQDVELFFKTLNPVFAAYVASVTLHLMAAKYKTT